MSHCANTTIGIMPSLLTAHDCTAHVHLIIGSNPLAASRISKSLEVGAVPKLICPAIADSNYSLQRRIDQGEVEWLQRDFQEGDLKSLGREDVGGWVDAVFVTEKDDESESLVILSLNGTDGYRYKDFGAV